MAKSPQGFIVVLPGEIIEIAQDDDISWLTLFYALPKELAEKYPDALKIPRSPYEVLYEGSYGAVAKSDMLSLVDSLVAPLSIVNALIAAVAAKREKELSRTFANLEKIWDEYEVYEKQER